MRYGPIQMATAPLTVVAILATALAAGCVTVNPRLPAPRQPPPIVPQHEAFTEPATGLVFPRELGGHRIITTVDHELQIKGAGVSISYLSEPKGTATVYLFDRGVARIARGIDDPTVRQALRDAVAEIELYGRRGVYRDINLSQLPDAVWQTPSGALPVLMVGGTMCIVQSKLNALCIKAKTLIAVTGYDNRILKLRYTAPDDTNSIAIPAGAVPFMDGLAGILR